MMMAALKLCREFTSHKDDNLIDAHGYLECVEWAHKELQGEVSTFCSNVVDKA